MKYRILGRTGLRVSEIGFGCGNVGGLMVRAPVEEQVAAVTRAMDLGINYFDTAPAYGNGQSESNLGLVLERIGRPVTVATKVGLSRDDLADIRGAVERSLETSLKRLRRDSVDILQLHTPVLKGEAAEGRQGINVENVLGRDGVAEAFEAVRSQGLVRFTGLTGLGDTEAVQQVVHSGLFDVIQVYYNLLNPSAGVAVAAGFRGQDFRGLIDTAARHDMGVVVIRVLAGGALGGATARRGYAAASTGGALARGADYQTDEKRAGRLDFLREGGGSLGQAAVRFALGQPRVSTVLVGFSSVEQIEEAVACSDRGPLPETARERLQAVWADSFGIKD